VVLRRKQTVIPAPSIGDDGHHGPRASEAIIAPDARIAAMCVIEAEVEIGSKRVIEALRAHPVLGHYRACNVGRPGLLERRHVQQFLFAVALESGAQPFRQFADSHDSS
jgi:hypothetical protein